VEIFTVTDSLMKNIILFLKVAVKAAIKNGGQQN
jgi:hypothetical protein